MVCPKRAFALSRYGTSMVRPNASFIMNLDYQCGPFDTSDRNARTSTLKATRSAIYSTAGRKRTHSRAAHPTNTIMALRPAVERVQMPSSWRDRRILSQILLAQRAGCRSRATHMHRREFTWPGLDLSGLCRSTDVPDEDESGFCCRKIVATSAAIGWRLRREGDPRCSLRMTCARHRRMSTTAGCRPGPVRTPHRLRPRRSGCSPSGCERSAAFWERAKSSTMRPAAQ